MKRGREGPGKELPTPPTYLLAQECKVVYLVGKGAAARYLRGGGCVLEGNGELERSIVPDGPQ